ncbi:MAG: hypothetical protein QXP55_04265 [Nitrososphaerales archaeon]
MKVGRGELWKGKRAEGLSLILCDEHLKEIVNNSYIDRGIISIMLEPLEDVDESMVNRQHLTPEYDKCQILGCKNIVRFKVTFFRSEKLSEWYKLKPPP